MGDIYVRQRTDQLVGNGNYGSNMTHTSILRSTSAATFLVGAVVIGGVAIGGVVAIGTVVTAGQADTVLNLFATKSDAPPSTDLKREADSQDWGLPTAASHGYSNFAQNASTDGGVSPSKPMVFVNMDTWLENMANRERLDLKLHQLSGE